jgi:DNA primase large subunit
MRTLHTHLRQDAHLKHNARLQFGLFLKGIGLPLDEALVFWRKAFHKMSDDQFQKGGYTYNIRHSYGMEGKRTNYTPYSCARIITTNHPGNGEKHGCPFRHYNTDNLRVLLTNVLNKSAAPTGTANDSGRLSTTTNSVNELLKMTQDGHYQVACTRLYEFTHLKGTFYLKLLILQGVKRLPSIPWIIQTCGLK